MSPVGWIDHTHVCVECQTLYGCDGVCDCLHLCPSCAEYQLAVEANERQAIADQDISRHERFQRGTPVGEVERKAFEKEFYGD